MSAQEPTQGNWFEVIADLLFLDGRVFHRGEFIFETVLGSRLHRMLHLGMIREYPQDRWAA